MSGRPPTVRIQLLSNARFTFLCLGVVTQQRLAPRIDRLGSNPVPEDARRLAGTNHVYRACWEGVRVLYHYRAGRITILEFKQDAS
ncbi:MAG: hypothetical protein ABI960_04860 [Candidatus Eisenbacteria bacterium]